MPLKMTSTPHFLVPYLQSFQNGGRSNSELNAKLASVNVGLIDPQMVNTFKKTIFVKIQKKWTWLVVEY
jgi:hypothetical protein